MTKQPSYRFVRYTEAWEQRKLGEVAQYRNGKAHENCIDENGKYIVVNSKFISTDGEVKKFSNKKNEALFENEIAFVLSDVPNGRAIARTFWVEKNDKYTLNQRIAGITPIGETFPYFLYILMNRHPYFLAFDDGAKQTNLSVSDVMGFEAYYPKYSEQQKIGAYFRNLDHLITLQQRKLEVLKEQKKTYLKLLFPAKGQTKPSLRFAGFEDEWKEVKLGEVTDRYDNLRVPVSANERISGDTPYYGANGIQDYVDGYTHDGEFYTPQAVSHLMTQIVFAGREHQKGMSVYDPTMGSGSLLLNAKRYSKEASTISYYGQELITSTFNLARMNMMLHGVAIENYHLSNHDTLDEDWPTTEPTDFDGVLMNPPYSLKWSADSGFLQDPRFSSYGVLAPKSKADFAFLLHGFYHLKHNGVMAIVLPHGVLFRGAAEQKIRQHLLEEGAIDTVIGLPANIFYNTSIPTTIIILKKNRTNKDVFFIDASKEFEKGKNQNNMTEDHIAKILETYQKRENVEKFAHLASFEEIVENDYNLNIPRYVDTFEEEPVVPLADLADQLAEIDKEIGQVEARLAHMRSQLVGTTPEAQAELTAYLEKLNEI